jgi:hypothetical protein
LRRRIKQECVEKQQDHKQKGYQSQYVLFEHYGQDWMSKWLHPSVHTKEQAQGYQLVIIIEEEHEVK